MITMPYPARSNDLMAVTGRLSGKIRREVAPDHVHIQMIDVKCDADDGMVVTVQFEQPFNGIIYSQSYFNDPKCR